VENGTDIETICFNSKIQKKGEKMENTRYDIICEICGITFDSYNDVDVCQICSATTLTGTRPKKQQLKREKKAKVEKKVDIKNIIKRHLSNRRTKLYVEKKPVSLERIVNDACEIGTRLNDIIVEDITFIIIKLKNKIQVAYELNDFVFSGYYSL
jgi:hypothetical protein